MRKLGSSSAVVTMAGWMEATGGGGGVDGRDIVDGVDIVGSLRFKREYTGGTAPRRGFLRRCCRAEVVEQGEDGATVEGSAGELDAGVQVGGAVGNDEHGSGVEQDDVAAGAGLALEDAAQDGGVGGRVTAVKAGYGG